MYSFMKSFNSTYKIRRNKTARLFCKCKCHDKHWPYQFTVTNTKKTDKMLPNIFTKRTMRFVDMFGLQNKNNNVNVCA